MEITKETMMEALPFIQEARRHLDTLEFFVANKDRLSLDVRVPAYYSKLVYSISELQKLFFDHTGIEELFARTLAEVSKDRVYQFDITKDHDGNIYFDVHGLLPLERVQAYMLLTGGEDEAATITVSGPDFTRSKQTT